jgi:hypothetical protein
MNIPPRYKESDRDEHACQAICLEMALAYFTINPPRADIYRAAFAKGPGNHVWTWGVCLAAATFNVHAVLVSKNPRELNDLGEVMRHGDMNHRQAEAFIRGLVDRCEKDKKIQLVTWQDGDERFLEDVLQKDDTVIVPTLKWNWKDGRWFNHSVVPTHIEGEEVHFNNPNGPKAERCKPTGEFLERWTHTVTDNDFFLFSKHHIDIAARRRALG